MEVLESPSNEDVNSEGVDWVLVETEGSSRAREKDTE
jgi:hypothetical protein